MSSLPLTLCSNNGYGFSQTTSADIHTAHFSYMLEKYPMCKNPIKFYMGNPINSKGNFTVCINPVCNHPFQWQDSHTLDLSDLFVHLRDTINYDYARMQCERLSYEWGIKLGVLVPYLYISSMFVRSEKKE